MFNRAAFKELRNGPLCSEASRTLPGSRAEEDVTPYYSIHDIFCYSIVHPSRGSQGATWKCCASKMQPESNRIQYCHVPYIALGVMTGYSAVTLLYSTLHCAGRDDRLCKRGASFSRARTTSKGWRTPREPWRRGSARYSNCTYELRPPKRKERNHGGALHCTASLCTVNVHRRCTQSTVPYTQKCIVLFCTIHRSCTLCTELYETVMLPGVVWSRAAPAWCTGRHPCASST